MNMATKIHLKLRRKWKYAINDLRGLVGLNRQLFQNAQGARIIIYHGICRANYTRFNSIFLTLKTFEKHLQFYKKYFHIVSLNDYYDRRFSDERFNICITFDDGFANNYKYVLPLMNKYQVPVAFFITAIRDAGYDILWNDFFAIAQNYGLSKLQFDDEQFYKDRHGRYVSKTSGKTLKDLLQADGFDKKAAMMKALEPVVSFKNNIQEKDYWLQMTQEEIKLLSTSPFATIGCHGYYHNDLSMISINDAENEICRSKQWLENITGKEVNAIAFPYGAYSKKVKAKARSAGFSRLLAMDFLFPEDYSDSTLRERFTVNPYVSVINQMVAIIKGKYE
jgi:peptidoglycan/xylan/chitin deacetylase (PgdA/CDA1 family)